MYSLKVNILLVGSRIKKIVFAARVTTVLIKPSAHKTSSTDFNSMRARGVRRGVHSP